MWGVVAVVAEPSGPKVSFVDVSEYRGKIDAGKVKSAGHVGLFPRTSSRTTVDARWHETAPAALGAGLVVAARHRIYRDPGVSEQFNVFAREVEKVRDGAEGLLISLDSEDDASWSQVQDFEERVHDRWGVWLLAYYPCWWLRGIGNPKIRAECTFWHSRYASAPGDLCGGRTTLAGQAWQWTADGTCPGVSPPVDLNWFYGTREQLAAKAVGGAGGDPTPAEYLSQARKALVTTTGMDAAGGSLFSKVVDVQGGVDRIEPAVAALPTAADVAGEVLRQLGITPEEALRDA